MDKEEFIKQIDNTIKATGNSDIYNTGMCNGMIFIKSLLDNKKPQYLKCPNNNYTKLIKQIDNNIEIEISNIKDQTNNDGCDYKELLRKLLLIELKIYSLISQKNILNKLKGEK